MFRRHAFEMRCGTFAKVVNPSHLIEIEDVVVVTRDAKGKVQLHQAVNFTAAGAVERRILGDADRDAVSKSAGRLPSARAAARCRASSGTSESTISL